MFGLSGPRESFNVGYSDEFDFCVWALLVDGLHVLGFDTHLGGDGSIRAVGLTAERWHNWVAELVGDKVLRRETLVLMMEAVDSKGPDARHLYPKQREFFERWQQRESEGAPLLRERLTLLRERHARKPSTTGLLGAGMTPQDFAVRRKDRAAVWPYLERTGPLTFYMVTYPVPAYHLVRPCTVIFGTNEEFGDTDARAAAMAAAAAELADYADASN